MARMRCTCRWARMPRRRQMDTHEKRRVAVDLDDLAGAFENGFPDLSFYLDVEGGEVAMVSDDTRRELEEIYQELDNGEDLDDALVSEAIRQRDVPDWVRDALEEADRVERGFGTRYVRVTRDEPHGEYGDMEDFIHTIGDEGLRRRMCGAIDGSGS